VYAVTQALCVLWKVLIWTRRCVWRRLLCQFTIRVCLWSGHIVRYYHGVWTRRTATMKKKPKRKRKKLQEYKQITSTMPDTRYFRQFIVQFCSTIYEYRIITCCREWSLLVGFAVYIWTILYIRRSCIVYSIRYFWYIDWHEIVYFCISYEYRCELSAFLRWFVKLCVILYLVLLCFNIVQLFQAEFSTNMYACI